MPRLDVTLDRPLLLRVLRDTGELQRLAPGQFSRLIDAAENARLLGWLLTEVEAQRVPVDPPKWLRDRLTTVEALVREHERGVLWEINRLHRALSGTGVTWILLKGAAYVAAALPPGRGRRVADIDVLVPYDALARVERALNDHGWHVGVLDAYDERYYRDWMHELPPMIHAERHSAVDVHHAILPLTSRLQPSAARLLSRAVSLDGDLRVLCPAHMVLHAAAHLFHDGEIAGAIRDVVDLDRLLRAFGRQEGFFDDLSREARALDLTRPAYYAIRYSRRFMDTPIPPGFLDEASSWAPAWPLRALMDRLVDLALPGRFGGGSAVAAWALYVRSHWLRMPPLLLFRHLLRKSVRRQAA